MGLGGIDRTTRVVTHPTHRVLRSRRDVRSGRPGNWDAGPRGCDVGTGRGRDVCRTRGGTRGSGGGRGGSGQGRDCVSHSQGGTEDPGRLSRSTPLTTPRYTSENELVVSPDLYPEPSKVVGV